MSQENTEINANIGLSNSLSEKEIPRDKKGKIRWAALKDNPDRIAEFIEAEAQKFIMLGNHLTITALRKAQMYQLIHGIRCYYPGQMDALRRKSEGEQYSPTDHFNLTITETGLPIDDRGRIYWSRLAKEDPKKLLEVLEEQVNKFIKEGYNFTQPKLKVAGLSGLAAAVIKYYPGGTKGLKRKIATISSDEQHIQDYDELEIIREGAKQFYEEYGELSYYSLRKRDRTDLENAIMKYPGRITQLKADINIVGKDPSEANQQLRRLLEDL